MKLISMTDFVLNEQKNIMWDSFNKVVRYANFLKQHLTLGMFIPCDEDGNILEDPKKPHTCSSENAQEYWDNYNKKYNQFFLAKERVLFEGFELVEQYKWGFKIQMVFEDFAILLDICYEDNIEELLTLSFDPEFTLTDSAIKQLGL